MTDQAIEDAIAAKGLSAPRVTQRHVAETIAGAQYYVFPGTTLTVCCMTLRNGFQVVGEAACASPENFDPEIGQAIAFKNAEQKIWALEGYLLRERLAKAACTDSIHHERTTTT
jgi:hypothetical protein